MRFLMLNWRDPRNPLAGGAERVTLAYLSALASRGHEVYWFANSFADAPQQELIDGVTVVRGGSMGTSIVHARRWYRSQAPFDLVIDQHHGIPWFAPWWARTRVISFIHEVLGPIWNSFYPWPLSFIGRYQEALTHWFYRNVPFWTACESTETALRQRGVRDVTIIRYGVETKALPILDPKPFTLPLRLVVVSRLAPNKRIDHAIQTVAELRRRGVETQLEIIGGGECRAALEGQTTQLSLKSHVTFLGPLSESEKDSHLRQAHFILHTSQREGWGLNIIEANAMGTPGAVYPVPGLIESTLDNQTGIVARNETPSALADRLIETLQQPEHYSSLRVQAWERAKTMHWSKILPHAADWLEAMAHPPQTNPAPPHVVR